MVNAARELGYRPHAAAGSLRREASGALGMLVPALGRPGGHAAHAGAFRRAAELGFTVVLAEDFEEQEAGEIFAQLVLEGRIDGLIIASMRADHPLLPLLEERPVPHVFVNRGIRRSGRNILMDDARSVELALDHLVELGHRSIVHVAGPLALDPVERRVRLFAVAPLPEGSGMGRGGGGRFPRAWRCGRRTPRSGALSGHNRGVHRQRQPGARRAQPGLEIGFTVPDDLSVMAHADTSLAAYSVPPLTAVQMPLAELGAGAVNALVEQIEMGAARDVLVGAVPKLALRASTAPPRSAEHSSGRID